MEAWGTGFPGVLLGIPREAPRIPRVAQGFPREVLSGVQGIPRELGFPEARDHLGLDGLAWLAWLNGRPDGLLKI